MSGAPGSQGERGVGVGGGGSLPLRHACTREGAGRREPRLLSVKQKSLAIWLALPGCLGAQQCLLHAPLFSLGHAEVWFQEEVSSWC